jgi:hypothetical protein
VVYCLWGAAVAAQHAEISVIVEQAMTRFLMLFLGGGALGALGGLLSRLGRRTQPDSFDMSAPQMTMNASITALPASLLALTLAAFMSKRLSGLEGFDQTTALLPLLAALVLVLFSHLAVTLTVPHEARMAEHRCGTDEVKMLAFVGIAAAPVMVTILMLVYPAGFSNAFILAAVGAVLLMSCVSVYSLLKLVLPRRASFPEPEKGREEAQAVFFGSIAASNAPRLIVLCVGCGQALALPIYVVIVSLLIDLDHAQTKTIGAIDWKVFLIQGLTALGLCAAAVTALVLIYMLYLNFGRWFSKRKGV